MNMITIANRAYFVAGMLAMLAVQWLVTNMVDAAATAEVLAMLPGQ